MKNNLRCFWRWWRLVADRTSGRSWKLDPDCFWVLERCWWRVAWVQRCWWRVAWRLCDASCRL